MLVICAFKLRSDSIFTITVEATDTVGYKNNAEAKRTGIHSE